MRIYVKYVNTQKVYNNNWLCYPASYTVIPLQTIFTKYVCLCRLSPLSSVGSEISNSLSRVDFIETDLGAVASALCIEES